MSFVLMTFSGHLCYLFIWNIAIQKKRQLLFHFSHTSSRFGKQSWQLTSSSTACRH